MPDPPCDNHSLKRHPFREMLNDEEFEELCRQVQFCEISWPIGIQLIKDDGEASKS